MECPRCHSTELSKNGFWGSKQTYRCRDCGRQFIDSPQTYRGYSDDMRELCLKMYLNGMGFRAIERVIEIHHTTSLVGLSRQQKPWTSVKRLRQFLKWEKWMSYR